MMKYFSEKNRWFIDKGEVKVYRSSLTTSGIGSRIGIQKIIIAPRQSHKILIHERRLSHIYIFIAGEKAAYTSAEGYNDMLVSGDILLIKDRSAEKITAIHNLSDSQDLELMDISIFGSNSGRNAYHNAIHLHPANGADQVQVLLFPFEASNLLDCPMSLGIVRGSFEQNSVFHYPRICPKSYLYVFVIEGNAVINGWPTWYNDAVFFYPEEEAIGTFNKSTNLLIIELQQQTRLN